MIDNLMGIRRESFEEPAQAAIDFQPALTLIYYEPNGRIRQKLDLGDPNAMRLMIPGCQALELEPGAALGAEYLNTDYIDATGPLPRIAARPVMAAALDTRSGGFTVSGLPQPCTILVRSIVLGSEESWTVEDGVFAYDDVPGVYHIRIEAFPFLDRQIEVTL